MLWRVEKDIVTSDTDRLQQLLMDETLPLFQRYRAMFSLRNKVNKSRIENNAFLLLQMLWRVEKHIVTSDTDRLQQLLMDETLPLFQRYKAMFSLRNKVNDSRIHLKRTSRDFISLIPGTCTCTCRGIPTAPSRRMLESLLLDEVHLNCYTVLCTSCSCPIFSPPPTISTRSSAIFWTAAHFLLLWFLLKACSMFLPLSHWSCFFSPLSLRTVLVVFCIFWKLLDGDTVYIYFRSKIHKNFFRLHWPSDISEKLFFKEDLVNH